MMSHVGNCLKLPVITLISFNHQTPLMPLMICCSFVTVHSMSLTSSATPCPNHGEIGQTWSNDVNRLISLISLLMSYHVLLQIRYCFELGAKTCQNPIAIWRHEIPSLHFDGFQDLNRVSHHLTYLTSSFWSSNHAFESLGHWWSLVVTRGYMLIHVERFYLDLRPRGNEATKNQSSTLFQGPRSPRCSPAVLCDPMPWLPVLPLGGWMEDLTSPEKITRKSPEPS